MSKDYCIATTIPNSDFYPIAVIAFCGWLNLKSSYRNWIHFASHINMWTVFKHPSSIDSVETVLSSAFKCFILNKEQSAFFKETEEWPDSSALWKKDTGGKSTESSYWATSIRQNQVQPVDQSLLMKMNKLKGQIWSGLNNNLYNVS